MNLNDTNVERKVIVKVSEEELPDEFYEITIPVGMSKEQFEKVYDIAVMYSTIAEYDDPEDYDEHFKEMLDFRQNCNGIQTFIEYMNICGFDVHQVYTHYDYEFTW